MKQKLSRGLIYVWNMIILQLIWVQRWKNTLINKKAASFRDYEWEGKGHSYISNFGLDLHRDFNSYYFRFILNSFFFFCILIALLLTLECKCEFYSYPVKISRNPQSYNSMLRFCINQEDRDRDIDKKYR